MQADEFEKDIRDKMEGFSLVPGSEVWNQVSTRLQREKKKRRVLFYWLFSGLVLLAGISAWWIATENKAKPEVNNVVNIAKRENYKRKQNSPGSPLTADRLVHPPDKKNLV